MKEKNNEGAIKKRNYITGQRARWEKMYEGNGQKNNCHFYRRNKGTVTEERASPSSGKALQN